MPICKIVKAHNLRSHKFKFIKQSLNLNFILLLYVLMERIKCKHFFTILGKVSTLDQSALIEIIHCFAVRSTQLYP